MNDENKKQPDNVQDENGNLQPGKPEVKIEPAEDVKAGEGKPEDTFAATLAKQNETINTLLAQIDSLNDQIANYVRTTGAPASNQSSDGFEDFDVTLKDDYVYLKDLGAEIGKR